ncbi:MAG: ABC transporter substrate-binding protein [Thermodesulfobacteriota bacterium]|nr:ABC transporter substrate-binding protein [Thermodesulfobacteriota bacterium]
MKKTWSKYLKILSAVFLLEAALTGPAIGKDIKIGVILPLTGKLAEFGDIEQKSFLMALNEINATGGLDGKTIDLIFEDTEGEPMKGRLAMEKLISRDKVLAVCGGVSSSVAFEAAAVAQDLKVPFLVNTASADNITKMGWNYIFRLNPPASEYFNALVSFLAKVTRVKTATIVYQSTPGRFGLRTFTKLCKNLRIKTIIRQSFDPGTTDFTPLLTKIKAKNPDLVYIVSCKKDICLIMQQDKELDITSRLVVWRKISPSLAELQTTSGEDMEYVYSPALWAPSVPYPAARHYHEKFLAEYGSPPRYHGAQAYSAMYVILDALKRAKSLTCEDIRNALSETDMMTVFGPVKFVSYGKKTQQNEIPSLLIQWLNNRPVVVWPVGVAMHRYVYPVPGWDNR